MAISIKVIKVFKLLHYYCGVAKKVGPKGQVVIPKKFRDELGIEPGDEVEVSLSENGVLIQSVNATKTLRGIFSGSGMLEMLMSDRRKEPRLSVRTTGMGKSFACDLPTAIKNRQ